MDIIHYIPISNQHKTKPNQPNKLWALSRKTNANTKEKKTYFPSLSGLKLVTVVGLFILPNVVLNSNEDYFVLIHP